MTRAAWERVCEAAKPGDVLRTEGRATPGCADVVSLTGTLSRAGRVLRTVRWTAPLGGPSLERPVAISLSEELPPGWVRL